MTDETTTQPQGDQTPATPAEPAAPVAAAPVDVDQIVSARLAEWEEKRITPLQRIISEREQEIQTLKTASMSEEDREQLRVDQEQTERDAFEAERWLFNKAKQNQAAADLFKRFLDVDDPEDQWLAAVEIAARLQPAAPPPTIQPEPSDQVPDIDPNNPTPRVDPGTPIGPQGQVMDKQFREDFLRNLGPVWPGMERG